MASLIPTISSVANQSQVNIVYSVIAIIPYTSTFGLQKISIFGLWVVKTVIFVNNICFMHRCTHSFIISDCYILHRHLLLKIKMDMQYSTNQILCIAFKNNYGMIYVVFYVIHTLVMGFGQSKRDFWQDSEGANNNATLILNGIFYIYMLLVISILLCCRCFFLWAVLSFFFFMLTFRPSNSTIRQNIWTCQLLSEALVVTSIMDGSLK